MTKIHVENQNGGHEPEVHIYNTCIFGCVRNGNEIPTAMPMFSRSGNTTEVLQSMPDVRIGDNQRWLPITGSRYEITHISAYIHERNEIPMAIPMFSRSGNTTEVLRRMPDVQLGDKSKMAACN